MQVNPLAFVVVRMTSLEMIDFLHNWYRMRNNLKRGKVERPTAVSS